MNDLIRLHQSWNPDKKFKDSPPEFLCWSNRIIRCDEIFHANGTHVYTYVHYDFHGERRLISVTERASEIEDMIMKTNSVKLDIIDVVKG